ncbi:Hypothetical predicted protein [Podarcis lilfordi]|uniref:Uncharacterized protein n=1 Tax=Podarcis lilfordi TaxID=74358 RepID=A0AA35JVB6_9SAUR|nr:Hypothetical predicted protein [Podarcis lilfordi]
MEVPGEFNRIKPAASILEVGSIRCPASSKLTYNRPNAQPTSPPPPGLQSVTPKFSAAAGVASASQILVSKMVRSVFLVRSLGLGPHFLNSPD